jgi:outer membrane lipoprotein-sorting protein
MNVLVDLHTHSIARGHACRKGITHPVNAWQSLDVKSIVRHAAATHAAVECNVGHSARRRARTLPSLFIPPSGAARMTALFLAMLSVCCTLAVTAAEPAAPAPDAAAPVLQQINARARHVSSFTAHFRQTSIDPTFDETDESSGRMFYLRHKPMDGQQSPTYSVRFDYLQPERSVTIMNPGKVILWQRGSAPQEHAVVDNLALRSLLAGLTSLDDLNEHFLVTVTSQSHAQVVLTLTPSSDIARRTFRGLFVTFDKRSWLPLIVQQNKLNGERVILHFEQPLVNRSIAPEVFTLAYLQRQVSAATTSKPKPAAAPPAKR